MVYIGYIFQRKPITKLHVCTWGIDTDGHRNGECRVAVFSPPKVNQAANQRVTQII